LQKALPNFDRSIELLGQYVQNEGSGAQARMFMRNAYNGRATTYDQLKKHLLAADDWGRAAAAHEQYRMAHLVRQGESLARGGQHAEAVELVKTLLRDERAITFESAKIYALAAQAAGRDETVPAARRAEMVAAHVAEAKGLLHEAKELDALAEEHLEQLKSSPDFELLRQNDSFRSWLKGLSGEGALNVNNY
jgi:tetratricopeptide (TPR) repeat protein